jgi:hypothetical protein
MFIVTTYFTDTVKRVEILWRGSESLVDKEADYLEVLFEQEGHRTKMML